MGTDGEKNTTRMIRRLSGAARVRSNAKDTPREKQDEDASRGEETPRVETPTLAVIAPPSHPAS